MQNQNSRRNGIFWCLGTAVVLLAICSKSSPLYPLNDWMDANIFYTAGKAMMSGQVLYRDVFDHKGPLLYLVYGIGWLVDHTGFFGIYLIEALAFAGFLYIGLCTAQGTAGSLHPAWVLLPGTAVAAGQTFAHGGSAEELCLPLLAVPVGLVLQFFAQDRSGRHPLPLWQAAALGIAAGCVLWVKFTMMGLFVGAAAALAVGYLQNGWEKQLLRSMAVFLAGMAITLLPWLLYFGLNGALGDFFGTYFGDNLFLYAEKTTGFAPGAAAFSVIQRVYWACHDAPAMLLLVVLGLVWLAVRRQWSCLAAALGMAGCLAVTALAFGEYHIYYALPLGVFAPLGIAPAAALASRVSARFPLRRLFPVAGCAAALAFSLLTCGNVDQILRPEEALPQYRFAAEMRAGGGGTLLNYGTLDGGFYTVAGQLPPCKYFCVTNLPLPEQQEQQDTLLEQGRVDWVVSLDCDLNARFADYVLKDQAAYDGGEGQITWYLYRKTVRGA